MDVNTKLEGFSVFMDSFQGSQMQNRFLYVVGNTVFFRASYDVTVPENTWHAGSVSFPVATV